MTQPIADVWRMLEQRHEQSAKERGSDKPAPSGPYNPTTAMVKTPSATSHGTSHSIHFERDMITQLRL